MNTTRSTNRTRRAGLLGLIGATALVLAGCAAVSADPATSDSASAEPTSVYVDQGIRIGDGPVEVILYGDTSCPYCAALEADAGDALHEHIEAGEITVVLHPMSYVAAKHGDETDYSARSAALLFAAADAGEEEHVLALYDLMLENQPEGDETAPTDEDLLSYVAAVGIETDLSDALETDEYFDLAAEANNYWLGRDIPGTGEQLQYVPTVAVDGTLFEMRGDGTDLDRLQSLIIDSLVG